MFKKRILLADADAQACEDFRKALGESWEVTAVADGNAALADMERQPSHVLVADLDLAELDGVELLNRIQSSYPKTIRFILANDLDRERMMKQVLGAHQFLSKPLDFSVLKSTIERTVALDRFVASNSIRELVSRIRTLPTIPSLYLEVVAALNSPNATTEQVSAIIAKDMAMMTKLLLVINSAGFGLSRKITNPTEAVGLLGFETVKSMVMTIKLLTQYDKIKPVYFSIDKLWRHSTEVARTAKLLTVMHTDDFAMAEAAFTAGLMHDLGKVVLAANFDEQYRGAQSLARKQQMPLWEVEREIFGASHGEIGAYLLGLWGMPLDVLEVAAFHHQPANSVEKYFTPLTAVHVANALKHENDPDKEGWAASKIDEAYLAEIGVLDQLPVWRNAVAKRDFTKPDIKAKPAAVVRPANFSAPIVPAKPAAAKAPAPRQAVRQQWIYVTVGAAVVLLIMAWLSFEFLLGHNEKPSSTLTENIASKPVANPIEQPKPIAVASHPAPVAVIPVAAVAAQPPSAPASVKPIIKTLGISDLKLQGIFFSADHPSAIISGKTVQVNDHINGVLVAAIKSSSVTLRYQDQSRTLVLR
jgi:HD-like signal output (HDOD) protein/CheY-like chemotaxis protein